MTSDDITALANKTLERPAPQWMVELWDAINRYVATCGGDASKHVYGNTARQREVANVHAALDGMETFARAFLAVMGALEEQGELMPPFWRDQLRAAIERRLGEP